MTIGQIRSAARVIGRRTTLRYLALGVGASPAAACTSSGTSPDGKTQPPTSPAAHTPTPATATTTPATAPPTAPATAPATAKPTVAERAFDAFVRGNWTLTSTLPGNKSAQGAVTVQADGGGNGGWTIQWSGQAGKAGAWRGTFLLRGGHLALTISDGPTNLTQQHGPQALDVPATLADTIQLTLPWQPPGAGPAADGQRLSVTYSGTTLRIVHTTASGSTSTHVCTRA
ncbi:hypothetical protein [Kitasatospora aureofaciens]|uniref:hypothetical protein n=1 Tax=Kitasatospora aureofaciens TaxID=1894 RepID=UPI00381223F9